MSNMYPDTVTLNPIGGDCFHRCIYCYRNTMMSRSANVKNKYTGEPRLIESEMRKSLGKDKVMFVCSMCDLFAQDVPDNIIERVIIKCKSFPQNRYLFQTKNPVRMLNLLIKQPDIFPRKMILGTTIETNRVKTLYRGISKAPCPEERYKVMVEISEHRKFMPGKDIQVMVSIEPAIKSDIKVMVDWMKHIKPDYVSVGADSKSKGLVEPSKEQILILADCLEKFTEVRLKSNLKRITGE